MMNIEELNNESSMLLARLRNINEWINQNPNTDPNLYEMTDCLMQYAHLSSLYMTLLFQGDPIYIEDQGQERRANGYDILKLTPLGDVDVEIRRMMKLRGVIPFDKDEALPDGFHTVSDSFAGYPIVESNFFEENENARDLLQNLRYFAITGGYGYGVGEEDFSMKKDLLCKIAGVYNFIWQMKRDNPDFEFDNVGEMNFINDGLAYFDGMTPFVCEGEDIVSSMVSSIRDHYKYRSEELNSGYQI